jgi:hypothetical protein
VTRPVMASMASATRLNWRIVVIVTSEPVQKVQLLCKPFEH